MKTSRFAIITRLILVAFGASTSVAGAQSSTTTTGSRTSTTTAPATATNPNNKLVDSYTDLAGSRENASSLVNGLRSGSAITLTDPSVPPSSMTPPPSTTFSPGTKPMGYGNIRIALSLARTQLASQGITNPTPEQLQGALVGTSGTTGTSSQGVLQMRASGMGWGEIANSMGVKLGTVMSGRQTVPATTTSTTSTTTRTGTTTGTSTTTAAGTSTNQTTQGNGNAMSQQHAKSGVVTAAGTSAVAANTSHGKSGITTAAGGSAGGSSKGVTTGLGSAGGAGHVSSGAVNASGGRAGGVAGSNAGGQGRGKP